MKDESVMKKAEPLFLWIKGGTIFAPFAFSFACSAFNLLFKRKGRKGKTQRAQRIHLSCLNPYSGAVALKLMIMLSLLITLSFFTSCQREKREFRQAPPASRANAISQSDLQPGSDVPPVQTKNPDEENAPAISEGKRLYEWYNCAGCHAHGGGAIGPPLMDQKWIYGSDPANIYETIVEGRPNGMPSFRGKINDYQIWEIVGYVRSLSGQVRADVAPVRDDHMRAGEAPAETTREKPKGSGVPKSAEQP
jgi:cytochrome c oxidase cbb3-type subunit 3